MMTASPEIEPLRIPQSEKPLGWVRSGRVPCLDGIRAISILLVIIDHSRRTIHQASLKTFSGLFGGHFGVTCFFVVSGFLVSLLLLREFDRTQTISLGRFYVRRALRLLPAYAVYLVFVLILTHITAHPISWRYWCAALSYTICYMSRPGSIRLISHLWSLAVEEHFYFLWPIVMLLLRPRRAVILAGVCIFLSPITRYLIWSQHRDWLDIDFASLTQMASIATGCVLAFVIFNYNQQLTLLLRGWRASALTFSSMLALLGSAELNHLSGKYYICFSDPAASLLLSLCVVGIWHAPDGLLHRSLNTRPIISLGILSYSIYLWQQLFTGQSNPNWTGRWPQNLLFILAAAMASHWIVERPFLHLKDRLAGTGKKSRLPTDTAITAPFRAAA